jgi:cyclopropane-fatty-acyl-phospholipid synthase
MSLRGETLRFLRSRLATDAPPLRLVFWDGESFDFVPAPTVTVTLGAPRLLRALLRGDFREVTDAYICGDIVVEGPIDDATRTGIALAERLERSPMLRGSRRLAAILRHAIPRPARQRSDEASHIRHHYDVSDAFYRLWLDERMIYSCAYFRTGTEDIDTAQAQKLEHICRKLSLRPGERLLDVGCGWGGLLRWAAERHGVTGLGITLSERQHAYARERLAASGIEVRLQNYRDLRDAVFDKVVSVGMYEHVGSRNLPTYFRKIAALLRPGGAFLNQGIVTTDPRGRSKGPTGGGFIDKYVFPGGAVVHLSRILCEIADAGLEVVDVEDLRPHYACTLSNWSRRLEAHRDEAIEAAGVERYRIWRVYLAGMAQAFDRGWLSVAQVTAYKPTERGSASRPWTREHLYDGAAPRCTGDVPRRTGLGARCDGLGDFPN